jgi:hypothetical protein
MAAGATFGAISSLCLFMSMRFYYEMGPWPVANQQHLFTTPDLIRQTENVAFHDYWWAGIVIPHAIAQCLFTFADLLILQRVVSNVFEAQNQSFKSRLKRLSTVVTVIFLQLNLVNVASMIACGVLAIEAGHDFLRSSAAYRGGDNQSATSFLDDANMINDRANRIQGARRSQQYLPILTLLLTYPCFADWIDF